MKAFTGATFLSLLLFMVPASAQWLYPPDPGIPRTRDGKPNLSARAPRTREGKPDLSGVWRPEPDPDGVPDPFAPEVLPRYFLNIAVDLKPEDVPFQPWAAALFKERGARQGADDPISRCEPTGVPAIDTVPVPFKIIQMPRLIVILYEGDTTYRQVFMDGRRLPQDPQPTFMGYSLGRWEGDTLVVDTTGINERSWLDRFGHPHSDALHVIERFRRRDVGQMDIQITIDDPKAYTRPLTYTQKQILLPDTDLFEYFCTENEKDTAHFR
jgi:hypothetical protein